MENLKTLYQPIELRDFKFDLDSGKLQRALMILLFALAIFTYPKQPSASSMTCSPRPTRFNGTVNRTERGSKIRTSSEDELPQNDTEHNISSDDDLLKVMKNVCIRKRFREHMWIFSIRLICLVIFGFISTIWIYFTSNELMTLRDITKKLKGEGVCSKCITDVVLSGDSVSKVLCRMCLVEKFELKWQYIIASEYRIKRINWVIYIYLVQNVFNAVATFIVSFYLVNSCFSWDWFDCKLSVKDLGDQPWPRLKELSRSSSTPSIMCFDPDADEWIPHLAAVICLALLSVIYIVNGCNYKNVLSQLCNNFSEN